jgi:hypothetical protein
VDNYPRVDKPGGQDAAAAVFVVPEEDDEEELPLPEDFDSGVFDSDFDSDLVSDLPSLFAGVAEVLDLAASRESVR